jgi:hypothetical protein
MLVDNLLSYPSPAFPKGREIFDMKFSFSPLGSGIIEDQLKITFCGWWVKILPFRGQGNSNP